MRSSLHFNRSILSLSAGIVIFTGCSESTLISSRSSLAQGMQGNSWKAQQFVDPNPDAPDARTLDNGLGFSTTAGFEIAASGKDFWLSAVFYDGVSQEMRGYVHRYRPGEGWGNPGEGFQQIAASLATHLELATIISRPTGGAVAFFAEDTALPINSASLTASLFNGSWQTPQSQVVDPGDVPDFDLASHQGQGNPFSGTMNSMGRVELMSHIEGSRSAYFWEQVGGVLDANPVDLGLNLSGASPIPGGRTVFDGTGFTCFMSEDASSYSDTRAVQSYCLDITTTTGNSPTYLPDLGEEANISLLVGDTWGFDAATDSQGHIVAVYFQQIEGLYYLVANVATSGEWSDPVVISTDLPEGFEALPVVEEAPSPAPAIAYLGSSKFLVVWAAADPSAKTAQVYSAVYDLSDDTWTESKALTSALDYETRPAFESIALTANGKDNAVVAIRYVATEGDDVAADVRATFVGRYHSSSGWLDLQSVGNGCTLPSTTVLALCSRRPSVAINSDGQAVVVYQDQDTAGVYRLAAVAFDLND